MTPSPAVGLAERYEKEILPRLVEQLDRAFPDFAFVRDRDGWRATNDDTTHRLLGCRADRVVCHGPTPRGILIHGEGPVLFTTLVNEMRPARGREFIDAVRTLANRVGIDLDTNRDPTAAQVRSAILHDTLILARRHLQSDAGEHARRYLTEVRGMPADVAETQPLGLVPPRDELSANLRAAGHSRDAIRDSGVLANPRWAGRLIGAWRDERGHARTLWTRSIDPDEPTDTRYLYLKGAPRRDLPPYGLSDLIADHKQRDLVLVEGLLDLHHLRARGIGNVAALGSVITSPDLFTRLDQLGVHEVTLMLDNDDAGLVATHRAVDNAVRATRSPDLYVARLTDAKDADEALRERGPRVVSAALTARSPAIVWRAAAIAGPTPTPTTIRAAGEWLGRLGERWSLEQDAAVSTIADVARIDPEATRRAFRARYWESASAALPAIGLAR